MANGVVHACKRDRHSSGYAHYHRCDRPAGQAVFYVQGWQNERTITLIIEKIQINLWPLVSSSSWQKSIPSTDLPEESADYSKRRCTSIPGGSFSGSARWAWGRCRKRSRGVGGASFCRGAKRRRSQRCTILVHPLSATGDVPLGDGVASHGRPLCPNAANPWIRRHFCPKKNGHKH
jgi:hypothetical protein